MFIKLGKLRDIIIFFIHYIIYCDFRLTYTRHTCYQRALQPSRGLRPCSDLRWTFTQYIASNYYLFTCLVCYGKLGRHNVSVMCILKSLSAVWRNGPRKYDCGSRRGAPNVRTSSLISRLIFPLPTILLNLIVRLHYVYSEWSAFDSRL
jgi:hypothetical protein